MPIDFHELVRERRRRQIDFWRPEILAAIEGDEQALATHACLPLRLFNDTVEVALADGSTATFLHAFCVIRLERKLVGIFTEHCGYFTFHLSDVVICRNQTPLHQKASELGALT